MATSEDKMNVALLDGNVTLRCAKKADLIVQDRNRRSKTVVSVNILSKIVDKVTLICCRKYMTQCRSIHIWIAV